MLAFGIIFMCFGFACTVAFFLHFMDFVRFSALESLFSQMMFDRLLLVAGVVFAIVGCVLIVASLVWKKRE